MQSDTEGARDGDGVEGRRGGAGQHDRARVLAGPAAVVGRRFGREARPEGGEGGLWATAKARPEVEGRALDSPRLHDLGKGTTAEHSKGHQVGTCRVVVRMKQPLLAHPGGVDRTKAPDASALCHRLSGPAFLRSPAHPPDSPLTPPPPSSPVLLPACLPAWGRLFTRGGGGGGQWRLVRTAECRVGGGGAGCASAGSGWSRRRGQTR